MFRNKFIVICLLVAGGSLICAQSASQPLIPIDDQKADAAKPISNDQPIIPTEASSTSTTTTTIRTTTTTAAPTTPTPTTTTSAPTTTTSAPTTTTSTPTTTTSAPTTTPAPTPKPTPIPPPAIGKWNSSCIMMQMAVRLNFTYETIDNKTATGIYDIPPSAVVHDSTCDSNTTQQIVLNWGPDSAIHSMTVFFESNKSNTNVYMIIFSLPIESSEFPNAKDKQTVQLLYRGDIFEAPSHMSYHCTRQQKFNLTETIADEEIIGVAEISDVQVEAFRAAGSTQFSTARDCDSSETPDIVPIAVGIALVALILIVLISYLCARRRSTARGYMSF